MINKTRLLAGFLLVKFGFEFVKAVPMIGIVQNGLREKIDVILNLFAHKALGVHLPRARAAVLGLMALVQPMVDLKKIGDVIVGKTKALTQIVGGEEIAFVVFAGHNRHMMDRPTVVRVGIVRKVGV